MPSPGFLERHRIVRHAIREDLLYFALPAVVVLFVGLLLSAKAGWDGLFTTLLRLISQPRALVQLSRSNAAGLALILIGFTILLTAQITLGRYHASTVIIRKDHKLIRHGIYSCTRNPMYLGVILIFFGVPVYVSSWLGLLTMSGLIPLFLYRIKLEERLLIEEFGDDYRTYRERTKKMIPFIY